MERIMHNNTKKETQQDLFDYVWSLLFKFLSFEQ